MENRQVFINCPFDNEYFDLLKALLFSLVYFEMEPLISETSDSGTARLGKIQNFIADSWYSIHDLSRMELSRENKVPRFNMPFECGIVFGYRIAKEDLDARSILILEKEKWRYQAAISDLAGYDIAAHGNQSEKIVKAVYDWLRRLNLVENESYKLVFTDFLEFIGFYDKVLRENLLDPDDVGEISFEELIARIREWVEERKATDLND